MSKYTTTRYCADPEALAAMKHDGLGWGHDVDCGCFHDTAPKARPGGFARILRIFTKGT